MFPGGKGNEMGLVGYSFLNRKDQGMRLVPFGKSVYSPKSRGTLAWGSTHGLIFVAGQCMGLFAPDEDFCVKHKIGRSISAHEMDSRRKLSGLCSG